MAQNEAPHNKGSTYRYLHLTPEELTHAREERQMANTIAPAHTPLSSSGTCSSNSVTGTPRAFAILSSVVVVTSR